MIEWSGEESKKEDFLYADTAQRPCWPFPSSGHFSCADWLAFVRQGLTQKPPCRHTAFPSRHCAPQNSLAAGVYPRTAQGFHQSTTAK
ncbi:hypothetical protein PITC_083510 [Penicillium italicum]|uniref:Uncharacterized protein n=1 Tax=Penicillium italicum TaxID=40296 RepID=A0A0A2L3T3_PENIT|nr:hypothetical protein PITC_083510 [Penicillium italicum]